MCQQLDAAYGYPNAETKTLRALPLVSDLHHDSIGRVYISIEVEYCNYDLPSQLLPQLLASGAVEEISESEYWGEMPKPAPGVYGPS